MLGSRALIVQSEMEEEFVELGFPLDALNAQEQIVLHAVIQRAIDGRKCFFTKPCDPATLRDS